MLATVVGLTILGTAGFIALDSGIQSGDTVSQEVPIEVPKDYKLDVSTVEDAVVAEHESKSEDVVDAKGME